MRPVYVRSGMMIPLGRVGENQATQIIFDISDWVSRYGEGTVGLVAKRCGDEEPYPVSVEKDGSDILWTVLSTDVAVKGTGVCELLYFVDATVVKSEIWRTRTDDALTDKQKDPPSGWDAYSKKVYAAAAVALDSAESAAKSAQMAAYSADKYPKISDHSTWMIWNGTEYEDTGVSASSAVYTHKQLTPSSTWTIVHNLGRYPSVSVVDSGNNIVVGDVRYVDNTTMVITFQSAFSGTAYLN